MLRRLSVLALALIAAAGCGNSKGKTTTVIVTIVAGSAPKGIDHIDLTVTGNKGVFVTPVKKGKTDAELVLPVSLKVPLPSDANGVILIAAKAFDATGAEIATGSVEGEVLPEEVVTLLLEFGMDKRLPHDGGVDDATPGDAGPAMISMTPASQDFGSVVVGQTSMATTFTVRNDGQLATSALHVAMTGNDAALFVVATAGPSCEASVLAAGDACTVTVSYQPSGVGANSAILTVSGAGTVTAALSGTGVPVGSLVMTPATNDFGSLVVGTHADVMLHVQNPGASPTGVVTSMLTSVPASELTVLSDGCATHALAPTSGCDIVVRFAPTTVGAKSGTFTVGATPGGAQMTMLQGRGIAPSSLTSAPAVQDFGTVVVGQTSDVTFTITNPGGVATGTLATALGGTNAADLTVTANTCTGRSLPANGTCTVTVHFAPTVAGTKTATFTVTGAPGEMVSVNLTAMVATVGALSITPVSNDFGSTLLGTDSAPITLTVKNNGGSPTGAITTTLGGTGMSQFTIVSNACGAALAANATCVIVVRFHPLARSGQTASLAVSGTPGGTATAALMGNGLAPATLVGDAATVDFGIVDVTTTSAPFVLTVRNSGDVPSGGLSTTVTGNTTEFTIANTCTAAAPLAAGATCTITVRMVPTSAGAKAASIVITGTPGGSVTLAAMGSGRGLDLLTVTKTGNGTGTVTSAPAGVSCGATCSASYLYNTMVTLTAAPGIGSHFTSWGGACAGASLSCSVTMTQAQAVTANFALDKHTVTVTGSGTGTVTGGGLNCPGSGAGCVITVDYGTAVTLTETPGLNNHFTTWGGACAGMATTCPLTVNADLMVTAAFAIDTYNLTYSAGANGTLTPSPAGIACGAGCATYNYNDPVTLTAAPALNYHVASWGGACSGMATTCMVTMTAARNVTVTFAIDTYNLTVTSAGGTVTSTSAPVQAAQINCGAGCTVAYDYNTVVTLTAAPSAGFRFNSWTGCTVTANPLVCTVSMTALRNVTANYTAQFTLTAAAAGTGTVTTLSNPMQAAQVNCGNGNLTCAVPFDSGAAVTVTATPAANNMFVSWGGSCAGMGNPCTLTLSAARTATANFCLLQNWYIDGDGDGFGTGAVAVQCNSPAGGVFVHQNGDCNDADNTTYPGAPELCGNGQLPTPVHSCDGIWDITVRGGPVTPGFCSNIQFAITSAPTAGTAGVISESVHVIPTTTGVTTYNETISFNGRPVKVYGDLVNGTPTITINGGGVWPEVSGNQAISTVRFESGETSTSVLQGFTITGGVNNGASGGGGGIRIAPAPTGATSNATLHDLVVSNNHAAWSLGCGGDFGGGILVQNANSTSITNVKLIGNSGANGGGMALVNSSNVTMKNIIFASNSATQNCVTFVPNPSGGGLAIIGPGQVLSYELDDSVFYGNAARTGGAVFANGGNAQINVVLDGMTLDNNGSNAAAAAVSLGVNTAIAVRFSHDFGNVGGPAYAAGVTVTNSLTGVDPQFVNAAGNDFHLGAASPLLTKGNPALGAPQDIGAYGGSGASGW